MATELKIDFQANLSRIREGTEAFAKAGGNVDKLREKLKQLQVEAAASMGATSSAGHRITRGLKTFASDVGLSLNNPAEVAAARALQQSQVQAVRNLSQLAREIGRRSAGLGQQPLPSTAFTSGNLSTVGNFAAAQALLRDEQSRLHQIGQSQAAANAARYVVGTRGRALTNLGQIERGGGRFGLVTEGALLSERDPERVREMSQIVDRRLSRMRRLDAEEEHAYGSTRREMARQVRAERMAAQRVGGALPPGLIARPGARGLDASRLKIPGGAFGAVVGAIVASGAKFGGGIQGLNTERAAAAVGFTDMIAPIIGVGDNYKSASAIRQDVVGQATAIGAPLAEVAKARFVLESAAGDASSADKRAMMQAAGNLFRLQRSPMAPLVSSFNAMRQLVRDEVGEGPAAIRTLSNMLGYTGDVGALEIEEMAPYLAGVVGAFKGQGMSLRDSLSMLAVASRSGQKPESVTTAIRNLALVLPAAEKKLGMKLIGSNAPETVANLSRLSPSELLEATGRDSFGPTVFLTQNQQLLRDTYAEMGRVQARGGSYDFIGEKLRKQSGDLPTQIGNIFRSTAQVDDAMVAQYALDPTKPERLIGTLATRMRTVGSKLASAGALASGGYDINAIVEEIKAGLHGTNLGQVGTAGLDVTLSGLRAEGRSTEADILELMLGSDRVGPNAKKVMTRMSAEEIARRQAAFTPAARVASAQEFGRLVGSTHGRLTLEAYQRAQDLRFAGDTGGADALLNQYRTPAERRPLRGPTDRFADLFGPASGSLVGPIREAAAAVGETLGTGSTRAGMLRELAMSEESRLADVIRSGGNAGQYVQGRLGFLSSPEFMKGFTREEYGRASAEVSAYWQQLLGDVREVRGDRMGNLHRYDDVVTRYQTFRTMLGEARQDGFVSPAEMQQLQAYASGGPMPKSAADTLMAAAVIFRDAALELKNRPSSAASSGPPTLQEMFGQ